jgi:hypothetical protein
VSPEGITTDPEKLKAVREWPTPKNKHEVRSFLGLCAYYRQFTSSFTNIAKPLSKSNPSSGLQRWRPPSERSREPCVLSQPGQRFIVDTDASDVGIGGVLSQVQDGQERVIAHYSKTLSCGENYLPQ